MSFSKLVKVAGEFGGYALAREITANRPRILMYHRFSREAAAGYVAADEFERQVAYIAKHFNPVTVSQIAMSLYEEQPLPRKSIAITVDDGYRDFYSIAWPVLKKYKVPATFYVTTGFVNGDLWLWPDQLRYLLERAPNARNTFDFGLVQVNTPLKTGEFEHVFWKINKTLLRTDNSEKSQCLAAMAMEWGVSIPEDPPEEYKAVTWSQLKEMQVDGLEVGGHTVTHPSLARVSLEEARREIVGCSEVLSKQMGNSVRSFCYPNGTEEDFVGEQVEFIREAGFSCATVAFVDSLEHRQKYALRRHTASSDRFQFLKAVSGVELLGMKFRGISRETPYD